MFNIISLIFLFILGTGISHFTNSEWISDIGGLMQICSGIWLFITFISTFTYYQCTLKNFENLREENRDLSDMKKSYDGLVTKIKTYLIETYPEYEKEMVGSITSDIILKFPDLQTSKMFKKLVNRIEKQEDLILKQKGKISNEIKSIRYYKNTKWELFTPAIPFDLKIQIDRYETDIVEYTEK